MTYVRRISQALAATLLFLMLCTAALAQSHERVVGPYVLRSSVVATPRVASESAREHGIEREPDQAMLNVIVYRKDDPLQRPLPAKVSAHATDLRGIREEIELRPIEANNRISYTGTFDFLPRAVLDFDIVAVPEGSDQPLRLQYREELWAG